MRLFEAIIISKLRNEVKETLFGVALYHYAVFVGNFVLL